jgi:hypothetical protein
VYFREPGFLKEDAIADTEAVVQLFRDNWGAQVCSMVFPRNQVAFTDVLMARGLHCWRENPTGFQWNSSRISEQTPMVRALRFADSVMPLGRRVSPRLARRASHFVRLALPPALWRLHRRRIVADARSLRENETLHLWFHPHNIGLMPARGVARFAELLDEVVAAAPPATRFMTMGEAAGVPVLH